MCGLQRCEAIANELILTDQKLKDASDVVALRRAGAAKSGEAGCWLG